MNIDPTAKPQPTSPAFIHSKLDEAGLTPSEFRIFCHIARRGECFAAVESIARICRLSEQTVRRGLKSLAAQSLLLREPREGETTLHRVAPMSSWNPSHILPPLTKEGSGAKRITSPPKAGESHPPSNKGGEVTPHEFTPHKGGSTPRLVNQEQWKLDKDKARLEKQIREEREKSKPDLDIIAAWRSELKIINDELRRRGKSAKNFTAADDAPRRNDRNAGTYNANRPPIDLDEINAKRDARAQQLAEPPNPQPKPQPKPPPKPVKFPTPAEVGAAMRKAIE